MMLTLPPMILAMLNERGGIIDPNLSGSQGRLEKVCNGQGYELHTSVIEFEKAFGGLVFPDVVGKLNPDEPHWVFGTHACLSSGGHEAPKRGGKKRKLVPVVYSPNDIVYFLDANGKAYAQDMVEDISAAFYAENGTALVCRILLDDAIFSRKETTLELKGLKGEALSQRFALSEIVEASGADRRYFSDPKGEILVQEELKAQQTRCACTTKDQLDAVLAFAVPSAKTPTEGQNPILISLLGKPNVRFVADPKGFLPDIFDHLPDLRELDVSSNNLETMPDSLWLATQLTALDISYNPLTILPDGIGNLKALRSLSLRGCRLNSLPDALKGAKHLSKLNLSACEKLDVDAALQVIAKLPKLNDLTLPLSRSLTSLAPLAHLPLKALQLNGVNVAHPHRIPAGLGQLRKLKDLRIEYADDIAELPEHQQDIDALRLLFSKRFTNADIQKSAQQQPKKLYLHAFAATL